MEKRTPMLTYRKALLKDIPWLVEIEDLCFNTDRMGATNFKQIIRNGKSDIIVVRLKKSERKVGYAMLLYRQGTTLARLYSFAIHPRYRGRGIAQALLKEIEDFALKEEKTAIRLEVRQDNHAAKKLYMDAQYKKFQIKKDFYEDHSDADCFEKKIVRPEELFNHKVPFYAQTTEFTCGPACLMMAMQALNGKFKCGPFLELQLWREATTIFMAKGHGGCGPRGLALAAHRRGVHAELFINKRKAHEGPLFFRSVRGEQKKKVLKLVHEDFVQQMRKARIPMNYGPITLKTIESEIRDRSIPLILISSYKLTQSKSPHWIVVSGLDRNFIYFHDPDLEDESEQTQSDLDNRYVPMKKNDFIKMIRFGSGQIQAMVSLSKKRLSKKKK